MAMWRLSHRCKLYGNDECEAEKLGVMNPSVSGPTPLIFSIDGPF